MTQNEIIAKYYEETDFAEFMKKSEKKKIFGTDKNKIAVNLSEKFYNKANIIDNFS